LRTLAIGDIHGCRQALERLVSLVALQPDDRLIFLGDYVDRGADTKGVIDWILAEREKREVITLRGNHEVMMMESREDWPKFGAWQGFGGQETLVSYGEALADDWVELVPVAHWNFLESTVPCHETETHLFVHGCLAHDLPPDEQPDDYLYWMRVYDQKPHQSGKKVICGHASQKSGEIYVSKHAVCIDTWPMGKWLTCLDVDTEEFWQASEHGP